MNQNTKFIYNSLHSDHFKLKYSKSGYLLAKFPHTNSSVCNFAAYPRVSKRSRRILFLPRVSRSSCRSRLVGNRSAGNTGKNRKHGAKCWPCPGRAFTIFESKTINVRVVLPGNLDIDNFGETRGRSRRRAREKKNRNFLSGSRAYPAAPTFRFRFLFFSSTSFSAWNALYSLRRGFFSRIPVLRRPSRS